MCLFVLDICAFVLSLEPSLIHGAFFNSLSSLCPFSELIVTHTKLEVAGPSPALEELHPLFGPTSPAINPLSLLKLSFSSPLELFSMTARLEAITPSLLGCRPYECSPVLLRSALQNTLRYALRKAPPMLRFGLWNCRAPQLRSVGLPASVSELASFGAVEQTRKILFLIAFCYY